MKKLHRRSASLPHPLQINVSVRAALAESRIPTILLCTLAGDRWALAAAKTFFRQGSTEQRNVFQSLLAALSEACLLSLSAQLWRFRAKLTRTFYPLCEADLEEQRNRSNVLAGRGDS